MKKAAITALIFSFFFLFFFSCASSDLKIKQFSILEDAVADNAAELNKEIPTPIDKKYRCAIMPVLTSDGDTTVLGDRISELYYFYIFKQKKFQLVERKRIDSLMKEHLFESSGLVDSEKVKELGKILSVDYILAGTIRQNEKFVTLTTRIINVETAELLSTAVTNIVRNGIIDGQYF